jgi:hypothetical protein
VAVTVKPPADALFVIGPTVAGPGFSAHIQVGMPMIPILPGRTSGTMPTVIAFSCINPSACCAS